MVAYALEVDPGLLPHVPELLADLTELGSDAELIVNVLEKFDLPESARVIDLGCGKGAAAVAVAQAFGVSVLGVELFEPFLDSCRALARSQGVADRCEFQHGNILELEGQIEPADVVIFAALGDVLGPLDETIKIIRELVKPGGLIVVSDSYIRIGGRSDFPGFEQYAEHAETIRRLTAWGDTVVHESIESVEEDDDEEEDEAALILARAEGLAQAHPELREALLGFAHSQAAENHYIDENLIGAVWVLSRL